MISFIIFAAVAGAIAALGVSWRYNNGVTRAGSAFVTASVYDVAWNGTRFSAVGNNGEVVHSTDGVVWTYAASLWKAWAGVPGQLGANLVVRWSGTKFLVVSGRGMAATSSDGITYTKQTGLASAGWSSSEDISAMTWDGTRFIVVGYSGTVATSTDGITWALNSSLVAAGFTSGSQVMAIASQAGLTIIQVNYFDSGSGNFFTFIYTTTTGATWSPVNIDAAFPYATSGGYQALAYGAGRWVLVGTTVATSTNGTTWAAAATPPWNSNTMISLYWNGAQFIAGGQNVATQLATSADGLSWTLRSMPTLGWGDIKHISGSSTLMVAMASGWGQAALARGGSYVSVNGVAWTDTTQACFNPLWLSSMAAYATSSLGHAAVGIGPLNVTTGNPGVITSVDGSNWVDRGPALAASGYDATNSRDIYAVAMTPSRIVITGKNTNMAYSDDGGASWLNLGQVFTGWPATNARLFYNGAQFLMTCGLNVATSSNGATWVDRSAAYSTASSGSIQAALWDGSRWIVSGPRGSTSYSTDGVNWTLGTNLTSLSWTNLHQGRSIAYGAGKYVMVSSQSPQKFAVSSDLVTWTNLASVNTVLTPEVPTAINFYVTWAVNKFFIYSANFPGVLLRSDDGLTWTKEINASLAAAAGESTNWSGSVALGPNGFALAGNSLVGWNAANGLFVS